MNVIKTERRATMHTDTLSDLIEIHTEGTSLANYLLDDATQLWWTACNTSRRVNQVPRKSYRARRKLASVESVLSSATTSTTSLSTDADVSSEGNSDESDNSETIAHMCLIEI